MKISKNRSFSLFHPTTEINNEDKAFISALKRLVRLPTSPKTGVGSGSATGSGSASGAGAALIVYREISKIVSTSVNFMMRTMI